MKPLHFDTLAAGFKNIAEDAIANLRAANGTGLAVRVEIDATNSTSFENSKVHTVSKDARTLKFDQPGFEES